MNGFARLVLKPVLHFVLGGGARKAQFVAEQSPGLSDAFDGAEQEMVGGRAMLLKREAGGVGGGAWE